MRRLLILVVFPMLIVATAGAAEKSLLDTKAPEFILQDQYDRTVSLRGLEGRIIVLIASDRKGKVQNPAWIKAIREKYGDSVVLLGVADVRGVPFFLKGKIKKDMRNEYSGSVLLDWKGEIFTAYRLREKVANVIVIDGNGMKRYLSAGPASPESAKPVFEEIDKLVRQ